MADYWTRKSGDTLAVLQERVTTTVPLPLGETNATLAVIGGVVRLALKVQDCREHLKLQDKTSHFVIRATYNNYKR